MDATGAATLAAVGGRYDSLLTRRWGANPGAPGGVGVSIAADRLAGGAAEEHDLLRIAEGAFSQFYGLSNGEIQVDKIAFSFI